MGEQQHHRSGTFQSWPLDLPGGWCTIPNIRHDPKVVQEPTLSALKCSGPRTNRLHHPQTSTQLTLEKDFSCSGYWAFNPNIKILPQPFLFSRTIYHLHIWIKFLWHAVYNKCDNAHPFFQPCQKLRVSSGGHSSNGHKATFDRIQQQ